MTVDVVQAWNGPGRHDGALTVVEPWHNALHDRPERSAFEHWYFDAHLDNGYTVVGFLMKHRPEDPPLGRPWVEIIVYRPDGTRLQVAQRYPSRAATFSTECVDVRIGPNSASVSFDDDGKPTYRVILDEDGVRLDLTFVNVIEPWMPGRGETLFGDGGVFGWCVGAPRAVVEGRVVIGDEAWDVTGTGYADHNWGVGAMPKVIEKWHWGRLYTERYSLLYAVVMTQERYGNVEIGPVMLAVDDEIVLSTGEVVFAEGTETLYDTDARREYPTSISLECPGRFSLTLHVTQVLHAQALLDDVPVVGSAMLRPVVERIVGRPGYFRFRSDFTLSVVTSDGVVDTVEGTTLHELVALR